MRNVLIISLMLSAFSVFAANNTGAELAADTKKAEPAKHDAPPAKQVEPPKHDAKKKEDHKKKK